MFVSAAFFVLSDGSFIFAVALVCVFFFFPFLYREVFFLLLEAKFFKPEGGIRSAFFVLKFYDADFRMQSTVISLSSVFY